MLTADSMAGVLWANSSGLEARTSWMVTIGGIL
jgi:hypothetical protein